MKRIIAIVMGVAALAGAAYLGKSLWAQPPAAAAPSPQTKIAIVNLSQVINGYIKWDKTFKDQLKAKREQADGQLKSMRLSYDNLKQELNPPLGKSAPTAQQAEELQSKIKKAERDMQDKVEELNRSLGTQELDCMLIIYKEVNDMVNRYARSRGIALVMHYNDGPVPGADQKTNDLANLHRHLTNTACMPMYWDPNLDITKEVVAYLNSEYESAVKGGR